MRHRSEDNEISTALGNLPRHRPSEDFTTDLLARLDGRATASYRVNRKIVWTVATLLIVAIGFTIGMSDYRQNRPRPVEHQELEALRVEYDQLKTDVAGIRRSAANSPAVVYLGGNESFDLVIDLTELATYDATARSSRAVPANHRP